MFPKMTPTHLCSCHFLFFSLKILVILVPQTPNIAGMALVIRIPSPKKWVCLKIGYIPNYSHLIGIMIINHWVQWGTRHFQTHPNVRSERWLRDGLGNLPQHYKAIKGACSAERARRIGAVRTNQRGGVEERDLTDGLNWLGTDIL